MDRAELLRRFDVREVAKINPDATTRIEIIAMPRSDNLRGIARLPRARHGDRQVPGGDVLGRSWDDAGELTRRQAAGAKAGARCGGRRGRAMSAAAAERRLSLWKILRRAYPWSRTTGEIMAVVGVYQLYSEFAYGGKDRLHDDLVNLEREKKVTRTGRPARWTAV